MLFRRLSPCLLSAAVLLTLAACRPGAAPPVEPPPVESIPAEPSPLDAFRPVLLEGGTFHSTDDGRDMDLAELLTGLSDDYSQVEVSKFAVADLDGDGTPEVLLWEAAGTDDPYGFEVLRLLDGAVVGYALTYRHFAELKTDGTFTVSGGAYDYGYGRMTFTEDGWDILRLASCETTVEEDGTERNEYFVCGTEAGEGDLRLALDRQSAKPDAQWLPYTPENVALALSAPAEAPPA